MKKQESLNEVDVPKLVVKEGRAIVYLKYNDIKWFKTIGNYTTIYLEDNKKRISRVSLLELNQYLPVQQFVRIHKSCIVNKLHVTEIRSNCVLIDDQELPIGRSYQQNVTAFLK